MPFPLRSRNHTSGRLACGITRFLIHSAMFRIGFEVKDRCSWQVLHEHQFKCVNLNKEEQGT